MLFAVHTKDEIDKERELFAQMLDYCQTLEQHGIPDQVVQQLLDMRKGLQELSIAGLQRLKTVDILVK